MRLGDVGNEALKEYKYYGIDYDDIVLAYEELVGSKCPGFSVKKWWAQNGEILYGKTGYRNG